MRPTQVLAKICKDEGLDGPHYSTGRVRIDNKVFGATSQVLEESGMCVFFIMVRYIIENKQMGKFLADLSDLTAHSYAS